MSGADSKHERRYMQAAIDKAREGVATGQSPFGAAIIREGRIIAVAHNTVWHDTDSTAHAEVNAIRLACRELGTIDLSGCTLYSTCEPCPMCFSAIHWAKIDCIVFGAAIADAAGAGFNELHVGNDTLKSLGGSPVVIAGGFMHEENVQLFREWLARPGAAAY